MATETARILQSHGLDANRSLIQAREFGLTDDTERPVIGTTVGGAKYLPSEELIEVVTTSPAPLSIFLRSLTTVYADTATAGGNIAMDITAGAQIKGYLAKVLAIGTNSVVVTYGSGLTLTIPAGGVGFFVWSGLVWVNLNTSAAMLDFLKQTGDPVNLNVNKFSGMSPSIALGENAETRVCQINANNTPDIPDDAAGTSTVQDEWLTVDGWGGDSATVTAPGGGILRGVATSASFNIRKSGLSYASGGYILRMRVKLSVGSGSGTFKLYAVSNSVTYFGNAITLKPGVWTTLEYYFAATGFTYTQFGINSNSATVGDTIDVDWVYVGTGAYSTKLVSLDGRYTGTINGALPVNGPNGKGFKLQGAQYIQMDSPVIGTTGSIGIKFKLNSISGGAQVFLNTRSSSGTNGLRLYYESNAINLILSGATSQLVVIKSSFNDTASPHTIVFSFDATNIYYSFDGGAVTTTPLTVTLQSSTTTLVLGQKGTGGDYLTGDIYDFTYDTAIWDAQQAYKYHIDPPSVDCQQRSSVPTPNAVMQWPASGNFGPGSGLETDKIPFATKTGTSTGTQGQASFDASYLYLCTATNVWKRIPLTSF